MDRRERLEEASLNEAMLATHLGLQSRLWTALPAIVRKVNLLKMTVEAEPAIQALVRAPDGTQEWVSIPMLVDVPLVFPSGGGYTLTFPVKAGDECLVIFASRCIDSWWQSGGVQVQAELRMHDLSDGFAIVGPRSVPRLLDPQPLDTGVELRSDNGHAVIRIADTGDISAVTTANVTVDADGDVHVTAGTDLIANVGGDATLAAAGTITLQGNVVITGTLNVSGAVTMPSATIGGVGFAAHIHGNVQNGSGQTNGPVNP